MIICPDYLSTCLMHEVEPYLDDWPGVRAKEGLGVGAGFSFVLGGAESLLDHCSLARICDKEQCISCAQRSAQWLPLQ